MKPVIVTARLAIVCAVVTCWGTSRVHAGVMTKAATEAAEFVMKSFGKEAAEQGVKKLSIKAETLAVKHGDDALTAFRKVGPKTFGLVDEAGEHGDQAVKLLAKYGDEASGIVSSSSQLAQVARLGDEAAEAMIKHGQVAEPVIAAMGKPAAQAMKSISKQEGRRLAMMSADGELKKIGRTEELLGVISRYGDKGMDFVWKNKVALGSVALLAAFLQDPEPYINGIAKPLVSIPGQVASEAAKSVNWTLLGSIAVVFSGVVAFLWVFRMTPRGKSGPAEL